MARNSWNVKMWDGTDWIDDGSIYRPNSNTSLGTQSTQSKVPLANGSVAFFTPETPYNNDDVVFEFLEIYPTDAFYTKISDYVTTGTCVQITTHLAEVFAGKFTSLRRVWLIGVTDVFDLEVTFQRMDSPSSGNGSGTLPVIIDVPLDNVIYGRRNRTWTPVTGVGSVSWGDIVGTLALQLDLQAALNAKSPTTHTHNDIYYSKPTITTLLNAKADIVHTHTLDSLSDVVVNSGLTNGQALVWNAAAGVWHNATITSGGAETDPLSLHLDQTTPQTVINGIPVFNLGITAHRTAATTSITDIAAVYGDNQHALANTEVAVGTMGYLKNTGSTAMTTGHGIGLLGLAEDTTGGKHDLYGFEGRVNGLGSAGTMYGALGLSCWQGADFTGRVAIGVNGRVEITTDGSTPLAEGFASSFYAPAIIGGGVGTKFSLYGYNPILQRQDALGTGESAGLILQNTTTGSVQLAPAIQFKGNGYVTGIDFPSEWWLEPSNQGLVGSNFSLRFKAPSLAVDNIVANFNFDGSVSFLTSFACPSITQNGNQVLDVSTGLRLDQTTPQTVYGGSGTGVKTYLSLVGSDSDDSEGIINFSARAGDNGGYLGINGYSRAVGTFGTYGDIYLINRLSGGTYGDIIFGTNNLARMTIKANGNVDFTGGITSNNISTLGLTGYQGVFRKRYLGDGLPNDVGPIDCGLFKFDLNATDFVAITNYTWGTAFIFKNVVRQAIEFWGFNGTSLAPLIYMNPGSTTETTVQFRSPDDTNSLYIYNSTTQSIIGTEANNRNIEFTPHGTGTVKFNTSVNILGTTRSQRYEVDGAGLWIDSSSGAQLTFHDGVAGTKTLSDLSIVSTKQTTEHVGVSILNHRMATVGAADYQIQQNSWDNSGSGAGTINHAVFEGFNVGRHSGMTSTIEIGKPSLIMGMEDYYFGEADANDYGMEWYVEYFSPDGTSIQMLRPFYARIMCNNNTRSSATIYSNIGADSDGSYTILQGAAQLLNITPVRMDVAKGYLDVHSAIRSYPSAQGTVAIPVYDKVLGYDTTAAGFYFGNTEQENHGIFFKFKTETNAGASIDALTCSSEGKVVIPAATTTAKSFQVGDGTTGWFKLGDATLKKEAEHFFSFAGDGVENISNLRIGYDSAAFTYALDVNGTTNLVDVVKIQTMKSGSSQANAGAAAKELWKTTSHATLPDNVVMIGV